MPTKTPKQHRAMAAACHGKSSLGIPKEVGCEMLHKASQLPFSQYVKKQAKAFPKPKSSKQAKAFPKPKSSKKRPSKNKKRPSRSKKRPGRKWY